MNHTRPSQSSARVQRLCAGTSQWISVCSLRRPAAMWTRVTAQKRLRFSALSLLKHDARESGEGHEMSCFCLNTVANSAHCIQKLSSLRLWMCYQFCHDNSQSLLQLTLKYSTSEYNLHSQPQLSCSFPGKLFYYT